MKTFLAVYLGTMSGRAMSDWNAMDPDARQEREASGMKAWGDWMTANTERIVEAGGPLGKTKRVDKTGVSDVKNELTGYVILKAESHEDAAKLFKNHPHFSIFPGEAVEIVECLPMPGA